LAFVLVLAAICHSGYAYQPINGISATYQDVNDTSGDYSTTGGGSPGFPLATRYSIKFNVGNLNNLLITGF